MHSVKSSFKKRKMKGLLAMMMALALVFSLAITPAMAAEIDGDDTGTSQGAGDGQETTTPDTGSGEGSGSETTPTTPEGGEETGTPEGGDGSGGGDVTESPAPVDPDNTGEGDDKEPVESEKPGETDPVDPKPGESEKPTDPDPEESTKPTDPDPDETDPVDPEPGESENPTDPKPGESEKPGETDPDNPGGSTDPKPGESETPNPGDGDTEEPAKPAPVEVEVAVTPDTKTEGGKTVTTATVGADKVDSIKGTISNADGDEGAPINVSVDVSGESADEANVNLSKEVVGALVEAAAKDLDGKATETVQVTVTSDAGTVVLPLEAIEKAQGGNDVDVTLAVKTVDDGSYATTEKTETVDGVEVTQTVATAVDKDGKETEVVVDDKVVVVDVTLKVGSDEKPVADLGEDIQITVAAPSGATHADVYYVNGDKLVLVQKGVEVNGGNVTFGVDHLTEFVITEGEAPATGPDDGDDDNPGQQPGGGGNDPGTVTTPGGSGVSVNPDVSKAQAIVTQAKALRLSAYTLELKEGETYTVRMLPETAVKGWKIVDAVSSDPDALAVEKIDQENMTITLRGLKTGAKVTLTVKLGNAALDELIEKNPSLATYREQVEKALVKTMRAEVTVVSTTTRATSGVDAGDPLSMVPDWRD